MKKYRIHNLDCPNCASSLQSQLEKSPLIQEVLVDFSGGAIFLDTQDLQGVKRLISKLEEGVWISEWNESQNELFVWKEILFLALLLFAFFLCFSCVFLWGDLNIFYTKIVLYGLYLIAGIPIFKGAYKRLQKKEFFDENFLMLFATISAFCIGADFEAVAVMLFFRVGEFFESLAVKKSRNNIQALLDINPTYAFKKLDDGTLKKVALNDLKQGDLVWVKAGEKVPSDGRIIQGESELDEKAINGESMPRFCKVGDEVFGGSINLLGALEIQILKPYHQSVVAKIIELIQSASAKKAHTEKKITAFAKIYTPCIFILSCLIAMLPPLFGFGDFKEWIYRALVVMMVSCPCALVLSVPLGYFGGIGGASKRGILIKGANYLEALAFVKQIAFDKTGTLTKGEFEIEEIVPYGDLSKEELLSYAMCAEHLSTHPIAQSLQKKSTHFNLSHSPILHQQVAGRGIKAQCCGKEVLAGNLALLDSYGIVYPQSLKTLKKSVVHLALNQKYIGYIALEDSLKDEAKEVIGELQKMGIEVIILSGDNDEVVKNVAQKLGIQKFYARLLPQEKLEIFNANKKEKSAFVGDGINDAPTLASADVGISIDGSDLSKESADVVLVKSDLNQIIQALKIAKKTQSITMQNIFLALGVKGIFIVLGIFGVAGMWEAVFGDVGVALLALLNASRVLR